MIDQRQRARRRVRRPTTRTRPLRFERTGPVDGAGGYVFVSRFTRKRRPTARRKGEPGAGNRHPEVAGHERRLPRPRVFVTLGADVGRHPLRQAPSARHPVSWGEAMIGSVYAFGVMFLAFGVVPPMDRPRGQGPRLDAPHIVYGPGGILKPQTAGGWNPITLQYSGAQHRRGHPRLLLRAADLHLELVAEARQTAPPRSRPAATAVRW